MKVHITRRRWASYFVPGTIGAAIAAWINWRLGAESKVLLAPGFMIGLWLFIALQTPRAGFHVTPVTFANGRAQLLLWQFFCLLVGLAAIVLIPEPVSTPALMWVGIGCIAWFAILMVGSHLIDRRYKGASSVDAAG
ncbi:MAG: hypothetical protein WD066_14135 [Planctomycetaceae bacterium]